MAIRITIVTDSGQTVFKVDGRLTSVDVGELLRLVRQRSGPVALDLTDLQSIDRESVDVLRELLAMGIELNAASPYVHMLLNTKFVDSDEFPRADRSGNEF